MYEVENEGQAVIWLYLHTKDKNIYILERNAPFKIWFE